MTVSIQYEETDRAARNRRASNLMLERLRKFHGSEADEIVSESPPLPPIPNKSLCIAHMFFPNVVVPMTQVEAIQRAVLNFYPKISMSDLKSQRRTEPVVRPRQIAMYLSKVLTNRSFPDIGRRFGGRDHTTVIHAVNKIARLVETDSDVAAQVNTIKEMLGDAV